MVFITATENKPEQHVFMKYKYIRKNILLYNIEEYKQKKAKIYESKHWMNLGFKNAALLPILGLVTG